MNSSPNNSYTLLDADKARLEYRQRQRNDSKRMTRIICFGLAVVIMLGLCIFSISRSFKNSVTAYNKVVEGLYKRALDDPDVVLNSREKELDEHWSDVKRLAEDKVKKTFDEYAEGKLTFAQATNINNAFSQLKGLKKLCKNEYAVVLEIENGRTKFAEAKSSKVNGDMAAALSGFLSVSSKDKLNYKTAMNEANKIEQDYRPQIKMAVNDYLCRYQIEEAREYINGFISKLDKSDFFADELERIDEYDSFQNDTVLYTGPVEHVFTHCLIAYPELCYQSPEMTAALDEDCITPSEFLKIFNALYEKDYILIDINILVNGNADGSVSLADLYIPKGKKPLVFSIDDVTYDSRKASTGMVDKLIVDEKGRVCTYTKHSDGTEEISYENEIFPLLETFVREHPDFTFRGARGTLCHTGFDGVFGYRTQSTPLEGENVNREDEIEAAKKVAEALRNEGWTFASHSYGHAQMGDCSYNYVKEDTDYWVNEVVPIVGETMIMVWPYGNHIRSGESHDYLYNKGFRIFCGVGVPAYLAYEPDGKSVFMDRKSLDGYALRNRREKYMYLFDTEEVWDPLRPKEITW